MPSPSYRAAALFLCLPLFGFIAGCSSSGSSSSSPAPTLTAAVGATSLTFASTIVGTSAAPQTVTISNTGTGALSLAFAITGTNASSFTTTGGNCSATLSPSSNCTVIVTFGPTAIGTLTANLVFTDSATTSPQTVALTGTGAAAPTTYSLSLNPTSLTFPATSVGLTSAVQVLTVTNTGTGVLSLTGVTVTGTNSGFFSEQSSTCGQTLNPASTCTASIVFSPTASGADTAVFTVADNAANSPQTVTLTGTAIASAPAAATVDCSTATNLCPNTFTSSGLATDPIAAGGFHGYADPSERKDPNAAVIYYAYSWAKTLADGTHVVDLHLAQSANAGVSFTYLGPLATSAVSTQTSSSAYSQTNDSSNETIDLIPIPLTGTSAGQTMWVQSHQSYLVKPQAGIYDQLNPTAYMSVSAVQLTAAQEASPALAATAMLGLGTAPEARLGVGDTDSTRNVTQNIGALAANAVNCGNFGQSALWYQSGVLYLALECTQITGTGMVDGNELAHFLYSTTPTGSDASKWTWAFVGEFATAAQAAKFGTTSAENTAYQFFTEPEFALTRSGQLVIIMSPSVFAPQTAQQPVIQYGCRVIPITLTPTSITLDTDTTTGAFVSIAKVTENDLYTSPNEGPAACTYEPAATNGIVIGRKYENDPNLGFYIYPVSTGILP